MGGINLTAIITITPRPLLPRDNERSVWTGTKLGLKEPMVGGQMTCLCRVQLSQATLVVP